MVFGGSFGSLVSLRAEVLYKKMICLELSMYCTIFIHMPLQFNGVILHQFTWFWSFVHIRAMSSVVIHPFLAAGTLNGIKN